MWVSLVETGAHSRIIQSVLRHSSLKTTERCTNPLEICDDRYQTHSTILASQIPVAHWHERIGDPTLADSIMDRLVHNAYKIELKGPSMRKPKGGLADQPKGDGQE